MKFTTAFVASILTASVYGLVPALNAHENVDIEARTAVCGDPSKVVALLRVYNPRDVDHLYTTNVAEFHNAVDHLGYKYEGTTGYIFSGPQPHAIPLYRIHNGAIGDHIYTTNAAERDNAVAHQGYTNEGITGYVYHDGACLSDGAWALYRLFNKARNEHLYTMSRVERDKAINSGYTQEGIAGYIFPPQ